MNAFVPIPEGGRFKRWGAAALIFAASVFASPALAQTVSGTLVGGSSHSWRYAYEAALTEEGVSVEVSFRLLGAGGVTPVELARTAKVWKEGVERLWNDCFALADPTGELRPIRVTVRFNKPPYHHEVVVRPGRGADDFLNWHLNDPPEVIAHEVAHAFGVYDEYRGGATAPVGGSIDPQGLMNANPKKGVLMRERFFEGFAEWYTRNTGRAGRLVPVGLGSEKI